MKMKYLEANLWKAGLLVSALLFLNIFILGKSYIHNTESKQSLPEESAKNFKTLDSLDGLTTVKNLADELTPDPNVNAKQSSSLNLKLRGTIIGSSSLAFISNLDSQKDGLYKLNGVVAGAKIVSITPGRVIVEKDGSRQELPLRGSSRVINEDKKSVSSVISSNEMIVSK